MDAYVRYGPALVRKAERMLKDRAQAQDIVHDLFVDLMSKHRPTDDLAYLYRAVTNRCLNYLRDVENRKRLLAREAPSLAPSMRIRADDQVSGADLLVHLYDRLDESSREIFVFRYLDDMGQEEIAATMRLSRRTVGKRLDRIRSQLCDLSQKQDGGLP